MVEGSEEWLYWGYSEEPHLKLPMKLPVRLRRLHADGGSQARNCSFAVPV